MSVRTLLLATRNDHKAGEIRAMLADRFQIHFLTLKDFPGAPAVVEDAATFAGNATKKAVELARWVAGRGKQTPSSALSLYVLADDSGLEVDALNGAPGVYSARFAALDAGGDGNSADADNNAKLLRLLREVPLEKRTARFRCVLALTAVGPGFQTELFDGACEGHIAFAPSGRGGFGYDPLFVPNGYQQSFAELGEETKNQFSHRAKALGKLKGWMERGLRAS